MQFAIIGIRVAMMIYNNPWFFEHWNIIINIDGYFRGIREIRFGHENFVG